ncbi:MAG: DUF1624 domain-containing protein [Peptococcaceae bacterium]|nr:DUF1624 domain-containing protein [Peptococcaceae bacterium]
MQPYSTTSGHSAPVRKRYPVLDCLRGILLLNMIAYHFLYDWVYVFGQNCTFMHTRYAFIWQQIICSGFILLAGCCSTLSRHAAKHGIRIFLCGMLITLVTTIATPDEQITTFFYCLQSSPKGVALLKFQHHHIILYKVVKFNRKVI